MSSSQFLPGQVVKSPGTDSFLENHEGRIRSLERGDIGLWHYATPIAPGATPDDLIPNDPLAVPFQNGWTNDVAEQAFSYRMHPATKVQIRSGGLKGGSIPSIVLTLPPPFRPPATVAILLPSRDGVGSYGGRIDPNGDVWLLSDNPSTPPSAVSYVPIADPLGENQSVAYTDPVSGNVVTVMTFPASGTEDTSVIAWAVAGDAFPRAVLRVRPDYWGVLTVGDGTFDPTTNGAAIYYSPGQGIWIYTNDGSNTAVFSGANDAVVGGINGTRGPMMLNGGPILNGGEGDPNGAVAGNVGDRWFRTDGGGVTMLNDYVCTTPGDAATAVWTGYA